MDDNEDKRSDFSKEAPSELEYLRYHLSGFNRVRTKSAQPQRNPAVVAEIYRNAMKMPEEISDAQPHANICLKNN